MASPTSGMPTFPDKPSRVDAVRMMRKVVAAGIGTSKFGKFVNTPLKTLVAEATEAALADAGIEHGVIDRVFYGNAAAGLVQGQEMIRGQVALFNTPLAGKAVINVENACASGSTAFQLGWLAVAAGQCDAVVIIGAEKLSHENRAVSFAAFGGAVDVDDDSYKQPASGGSIFMEIYAAKARKWMRERAATPADLAQVVVNSRLAGSLNPIAQFRQTTTVDEVLGSRMVADPLTLFMCSSIGDGASAVVLCSEARARQISVKTPVFVQATAMVSAEPRAPHGLVAERAAKLAYEQSGISPDDVDVAELHDASAPAELIHYENLAFCAPGEAVSLLRSGATAIGGAKSINPSGGLLSRGHPLGATGVAQIVELTQQLRGEAGPRQRPGAKVALAENNGGQLGGDSAVACVTILSR